MCGIIACVGAEDTVGELMVGLENLEYRGYDSAGIAVKNGSGIAVRKRAGELTELKDALAANIPHGTVGIGHTRWSTHGPPTDQNAHPHTSDSGRVAVVHNGIIENHSALRERLSDTGIEFTSETDTEVIPHLIEHHLDSGLNPAPAIRATIADLEGSFALVAMVDGYDAVYAARRDSPLVLGLDDDRYYLASDVPAFIEFTDRVVYLEDGDVATVHADSVTVTDADGSPVDRTVDTVEWSADDTGKGMYDHYMLKEIHNQPEALANTIGGRIQDSSVRLDAFPPETFEAIDQVEFVACGTSYHAALYGVHQLSRAGIPARAHRASEYTQNHRAITDRTLVVGVTQSGETADTLSALRRAASAGARTVVVTNVVGSTAAREADDVTYIRAGPEIGVAATKTFSSQVVTLTMLTHRIADDTLNGRIRKNADTFFRELQHLPSHIEDVLETSQARAISQDILGQDSYFFIGRDLEYPVALEGALKFKEITYEHAEGFASGQLKHGPLALVTPDATVFALVTGQYGDDTRKNAEEARTRGADVVAIAPEDLDVRDVADEVLRVPDVHPDLQGLLANVQLQLISYHTADALGREIDKPRNLAKSVTVE